MRTAFFVLLVVHAAIHLLGFAKAFELAKVPQLTTAISRPLGALWLFAGAAFALTALLLFLSPERWWIAGLVALVASQTAIFSAWSDAKAGTVVNLVVLVPLALALLDARSSSFPSIYRREVHRGLARAVPQTVVTEAELASLPAPLRTYLMRAGVVGRPHVQNFRARWHGSMRNGEKGGWMSTRVEQVEFFDRPARLFYMEASRSGVPFQALHVYEDATATMRVRVASLIDVVDARGPEMNRSETVTLFNDMCLLAPASLLHANVVWRVTGERNVIGSFTNGGNTVEAELLFDAAGDLVDFVSHDRYQSADGKTYRKVTWSTPVRDYKSYGGVRLASYGEAVWRETTGDFVYARFFLDDIEFNVRDAAPDGKGAAAAAGYSSS